jgi:hypothetical protein
MKNIYEVEFIGFEYHPKRKLRMTAKVRAKSKKEAKSVLEDYFYVELAEPMKELRIKKKHITKTKKHVKGKTKLLSYDIGKVLKIYDSEGFYP